MIGMEQSKRLNELLQAGGKMYNLKRLFNCRAGKRREDEIIPEIVSPTNTRELRAQRRRVGEIEVVDNVPEE